ncbi:UNVERIFIED_CONTAM: hypothetical protein GTU68_002263 [Idotea baltica]|nr:hypothetical protein [Idotea baltica]
MNYNWDWGILFREPYLEWLISGLGWTLSLSLAAWIIAFVLGSILGIMRTSSISILRFIATTYVEIFRNIPLLVQLFLWYFVFPELLPDDAGRWVKREMPMPALIVAFILFEAAYYTEIIRAGISSVSKGQLAAGRAIGLTYPQTMRYVILPQAFRAMVPVLLTQAIILFQDTSLVYVVGLKDFLVSAELIANRDQRLVEMYIFIAIVYFVICFAASLWVRRLQKRLATS